MLMIVTVNLNVKFINKIYCLLKYFLEFNKQNMFFCCYEIIPILVKEALAMILTKKKSCFGNW